MNLILDLLFPKKCAGCKVNGGYFCQDCVKNTLQGELICPQCKKWAVGGQTHPLCRKKFGLDGLWSLGLYRHPLKNAIQQLKYKHISPLADILVDLVLEYWVKYQPFILDRIKQDYGEGWVVIPVPLHWFKENKRGFNQSSLFAKSFAAKLGLEYKDCIKRIRYTRSQTKLKGKDRYQNIKNAFSLSPNIPISQYPNILLIDDVWTTGSTMKECCSVLKKAGVKQVWGITLAR